jgi:hypothetical protein
MVDNASTCNSIRLMIKTQTKMQVRERSNIVWPITTRASPAFQRLRNARHTERRQPRPRSSLAFLVGNRLVSMLHCLVVAIDLLRYLSNELQPEPARLRYLSHQHCHLSSLTMVRTSFAAALLAGIVSATPQQRTQEGNTQGYPFVDPLSDYQPPPNPYNIDGAFIDWRTYKANGVNLGSWLEKERTHDPIWWVDVGGESVIDEWAST